MVMIGWKNGDDGDGNDWKNETVMMAMVMVEKNETVMMAMVMIEKTKRWWWRYISRQSALQELTRQAD